MSIAQNNTPGYPNDVVAANIRAELARAGITKRAAALNTGLTPMYVNRRLSGEVELSINDLVTFASLLGIDTAVLLEGTKNAPTPKGGGKKLPELDSNQQPAGNKPGDVLMFPNMTEIHPENEDETDAEIIPMFA